MLAQDAAVGVDEVALGIIAARKLADDVSVLALWHEADVLAVGLVGIYKAVLLGEGARLLLGEVPHRQEHMREHLLRKRVQHVALVLVLIRRLQQSIAVAALLDACVMARDDLLAAEHLSALKELVELHKTVAVYAGVRREAVLVRVNKLIYNMLAEAVLEIEDVVRHAEPESYRASILHVIQGAACVGVLLHHRGVVMKLHGAADALISFFLCKICRDG